MQHCNEKEAWDSTAALLGDLEMSFGQHWSFNFRNDPKRLGFVLSRYKFASKMLSKKAKILELGCSIGIGATILAENALNYTGIDLDLAAIESAKQNLSEDKFRFIFDDFMGKHYGEYEAVVSLDVIEHIYPEFEKVYLDTVVNNLSSNGIAVIGTPNITSSAYASKASEIGHVNLYSQKRLVETLKTYFHQVFPFGMNDETVHTGFAEMSHYLICVCCHKK